jgi:hypothetical protein
MCVSCVAMLMASAIPGVRRPCVPVTRFSSGNPTQIQHKR